MVMDAELLKHLTRTRFGDASGLFDCLFEILAKGSGQSCHRPLLP